jgi:hypothetical protein
MSVLASVESRYLLSRDCLFLAAYFTAADARLHT